MDAIQPYLDYFSANPEWAIAIVFLIAFGEALLIIGLFVPSTAVLVGAGMLVGTGNLPFWPVFWATAIGAIAGDQISYWAGRMFGQQLKLMWPLRKYATLVNKGEDFVRQHGGKSIAVGRFIPGIKAVVPGIVGMLGMNQAFFLFVNITSGLFWTAMHVFPGILLGQGLAIAGDLSGRLLIVLLVLLVILGVAGWIIRLLAGSLAPRMRGGMHILSTWARARGSRSMHRFGRFASPNNPRSYNFLVYGLALFAALLGFAYLVLSLLIRESASNFDRSIATLFGELRNSHSDDLMVPLMMMGDARVVSIIVAALLIWLIVHKAWRAVALTAFAWAAAFASIYVLRWALDRPGPIEAADRLVAVQSGFPNVDVTLAATAFGFLIVFAGHAMGRWSRAVVAASCGLWVLMLSFARLYLGTSWLSDILAGLLLAAIIVAAFGLVIEAVPARRIRPLGLLAGATVVYLLAAIAHVGAGGERAAAAYERVSTQLTITEADWLRKPLQHLPSRRIDLAGKPEDVFIAQWRGDISTLRAFITTQGWTAQPKWQWRDGFSYLDTHASISKLPPKPLLNEGLKAVMTAIKMEAGDTATRLVLRAYRSRLVVDGKPVFLFSLSREIARTSFQLYALPKNQPASTGDIERFQHMLSTQPGVRQLVPVASGQNEVKVLSQ
jgi:membrane protein DedA with SNARE-associated domain/membrane-associated phospholipid phosphatase